MWKKKSLKGTFHYCLVFTFAIVRVLLNKLLIVYIFFFIYLVWVWIPLKTTHVTVWRFSLGSHALFMRPASKEKDKFCFKIESHGTIHTFKNYFSTVFLVISFQFSVFNNKRYPNWPLEEIFFFFKRFGSSHSN